jgi:uncharacterized protein DUF5658
MYTLLVFLLLQAADFATTIAILSFGGVEKNPLVIHMMAFGSIKGLLVAKVLSMAIGTAAALAGKDRGIRLVNIIFVGVVLWNMSIITRLLMA